jgi:DNA-binding NarL/FixJ family response regulator
VEIDALLARGGAALDACDWGTARSCFEEAFGIRQSPQAADGLGHALYWLGDHEGALTWLERAYAGYRARGDTRPAAAVAIHLAMIHALTGGSGAAVSGWVGHAERMLEHTGECPEVGWVELFLALITPDPQERARRASAAVEIGRRCDVAALEFDARAYLGQALVEAGDVGRGLRLVDEAVAAITGGLVTDPWATAEILCTMFHACELALDLDRAEEWLGLVDSHVERTGEVPTFGTCRTHYGGLLTATGRWDDAERELRAAITIHRNGFHGLVHEPLIRLADLRSRQGRYEEARRLLDGYEDHPAAALPHARIHLAAGEPVLAATVLERHLRRRGRGVLSAPVLAQLILAQLSAGAPREASRLADELDRLADTCALPPVTGLAALSRARVAVTTSGGDAAEHYEAAIAAFVGTSLPYELGTTRLELARLLIDERPEVARAEARAALRCFERLPAARDADAAAEVLRRLGDPGRSRPRLPGPLTERETEVLDLLAEGLTNAGIGERLFISPRTAEYHVSNILTKLGMDNRAEAAAHAIRRRHGPESSGASGP